MRAAFLHGWMITPAALFFSLRVFPQLRLGVMFMSDCSLLSRKFLTALIICTWAPRSPRAQRGTSFPFWQQYSQRFTQFSQFSSVTQSCPTLCDPTDSSMPGLPVHHQLPEFTQTHVHWVGDAIQPSNLLSSPSPPTFNLSQHQGLFQWVSSNEHRWPKYWSFSFNICPSDEHPGLIAFRMDWLHLLAVQGTLKSLLQHHSSKTSILQHSAFFIVQLSHPYMTTGKTISLTRQTELCWQSNVSAF